MVDEVDTLGGNGTPADERSGSNPGTSPRSTPGSGIGPYAAPYVPEAFEPGWNEAPIGPDYAMALAPTYFNWRKASIYGGSNEIQKNIIAKMVRGL